MKHFLEFEGEKSWTLSPVYYKNDTFRSKLLKSLLLLLLSIQIISILGINQTWLITLLFVYVLESDLKTDRSKKICLEGWFVGQFWVVRSFCMTERFALPTSDHRFEIGWKRHTLNVAKHHCAELSESFHYLDISEILLKKDVKLPNQSSSVKHIRWVGVQW